MAADEKQVQITRIVNELELGFDLGNVLKNIARAAEGDELANLKKAQFYLNSRIETIETDAKRAQWRNKKKVARKKSPVKKVSKAPKPVKVAPPKMKASKPEAQPDLGDGREG